MASNLMEKIVALAKRRGFIYPSSEIYGGLGGAYDYGPLGVILKNNLKALWWEEMVEKREDIVALESSILMARGVWQASGHEKGFSDPLVECKNCHQRFRKDEVEEKCPNCGKKEFTQQKQFNLMFKTFVGPVEDESNLTFLRPETAQGIFVNFKNILETSRLKLPFGVAQIGKAFRNEITPRNFIFRTREFEQGELEYFVHPKESEKWYKYWVEERLKWWQGLGIKKENLRLRPHPKEELAHYAMASTDVEYKFPFGHSELEGIANRKDYDLVVHEKASGKDLKYFEEKTKEKFHPFIIEPSAGFDRMFLAVLVDGYEEVSGNRKQVTGKEYERAEGEVVLHLNPKIAPIKVAVFPLVNKDKLPEIAKKIYEELKEAGIASFYDDSGSIGRRYRRQDEIGTPWCVTVDFETLKNDTVTVRDRDSLKQERVKIKELKEIFRKKLG